MKNINGSKQEIQKRRIARNKTKKKKSAAAGSAAHDRNEVTSQKKPCTERVINRYGHNSKSGGDVGLRH